MGNFIGLNDQEWAVVEHLIPYRWGITQSGTQPLHPRKILNTLIWMLTTGARWCDVPVGEQWASRSCAHKYLGRWKENKVLERVLIEADKGYDTNELRLQILAMKLFPYIPHRRMGQYKSKPQVKILEKHRWKVERGISWLQRKYRRLVVRWERRMKYWEGFLGLGILLYWVRELIKWGLCG